MVKKKTFASSCLDGLVLDFHQVRAIISKDLTLQWRKWKANICQILTPIICLLFIFILQIIVDKVVVPEVVKSLPFSEQKIPSIPLNLPILQIADIVTDVDFVKEQIDDLNVPLKIDINAPSKLLYQYDAENKPLADYSAVIPNLFTSELEYIPDRDDVSRKIFSSFEKYADDKDYMHSYIGSLMLNSEVDYVAQYQFKKPSSSLVSTQGTRFDGISPLCELLSTAGFASCEIILANYITDLVHSSYLWNKTNNSAVSLSFAAQMPYDIKLSAVSVEIVELLSAFIFPLLLIVPLPNILYSLVLEKEKNIKEMMNLMGLRERNYIIPTFCVKFAQVFLTYFAMFLFGLMLQLRIFIQTNVLILLYVGLVSTLVVVSLAFFISSVIRNTFIATIVAYLCVVFFPIVGFFLNQFVLESGRYEMKWMLFVSPLTITESVTYLSSACNSYRCLGFDAFVYSPDFAIASIMGLVDFCIYMLLSFYLDLVMPKPWGIRKHPLFFLNYFCCWCFIPNDTKSKILNFLCHRSPKINSNNFELEKKTEEEFSQEDGELDLDVFEMKRRIVENELEADEQGIVVKGLKKLFSRGFLKKKHTAVNNIYFNVGKNECFGLLGSNGAGKSTTISILSGLYSQSGGTAFVNETLELGTNMAEIRRSLGLCPQFTIQWDDLTPSEHLLFYNRLKGTSLSKEKKEVRKLLEKVELLPKPRKRRNELWKKIVCFPLDCFRFIFMRSEKKSGELSGGMMRRLAIAISLCGNPKVVLFDEPTTGLDPFHKRGIWNVIMKEKENRSIILTTHSMVEAEVLADRVAIMNEGNILCVGPTLFLKDKFAPGYTVVAKLGNSNISESKELKQKPEKEKEESGIIIVGEEVVENFKNAVIQNFGDFSNVTVLSDYESSVTRVIVFDISKLDDKEIELWKIFEGLEEMRVSGNFQLLDFEVNQTSLEDVFMYVVQQGIPEKYKMRNIAKGMEEMEEIENEDKEIINEGKGKENGEITKEMMDELDELDELDSMLPQESEEISIEIRNDQDQSSSSSSSSSSDVDSRNILEEEKEEGGEEVEILTVEQTVEDSKPIDLRKSNSIGMNYSLSNSAAVSINVDRKLGYMNGNYTESLINRDRSLSNSSDENNMRSFKMSSIPLVLRKPKANSDLNTSTSLKSSNDSYDEDVIDPSQYLKKSERYHLEKSRICISRCYGCMNYPVGIFLQVMILLEKNCLLSCKNWKTTCIQILSPFFVVLLLFVLTLLTALIKNEEIIFQRTIPVENEFVKCTSWGGKKCYTLAYTTNGDTLAEEIMDDIIADFELSKEEDVLKFDKYDEMEDYLYKNPNTTQTGISFLNLEFLNNLTGRFNFNLDQVRDQIDIFNALNITNNFLKVLNLTNLLFIEQTLNNFNFSILNNFTFNLNLSVPNVTLILYNVYYNATLDMINQAIPVKTIVDNYIFYHVQKRRGVKEDENGKKITKRTFTFSKQNVPQIERRGRIDGQAIILAATGPLFFSLSTLTLFVISMYRLVLEKETELRYTLEMIGMKKVSYLVSWFITFVCFGIMMTIVTIVSGEMFFLDPFVNSNPMFTFFIFFIFQISLVCLAFTFSSCFTGTKSALIFGFIFLSVTFILNLFVGNGIVVYLMFDLKGIQSMIPLIFEIFYPPFNFAKIFQDIINKTVRTYDGNKNKFVDNIGYKSWSDFVTPNKALGIETPATYRSVLMLLLNCFLYLSFFLYLDQIMPTPKGNSKHPLFFCNPKYWLRKCGLFSGKENISPDLAKRSKEDLDIMKEDLKLEYDRVRDPSYDSMIRIANLKKTYSSLFGRKVKALKGIDLSCSKGSVLAFLGHNGAGKSTTINMIAGLMRQNSGEIFVNNYNTQNHISKVREVLGVCLQHDTLWSELTCNEHMRIFCRMKGILWGKKLQKEMKRRLEEVGLYSVRKRRAGNLSGGMKRRLSCALSFVGNPKLVILDEPTTGMDPVSKRLVWKVIENATNEKRISIMLTTHSMEEADHLSHTISILQGGKILVVGDSLDLKSKLGKGYVLKFICESGREVEFEEFISNILGESGISLLMSNSSSFIYNISKSKFKEMISGIKEIEEEMKKKRNSLIRDFGVSSSKLEDIYLRVTKEEEEKEKKRKELKKLKNLGGENEVSSMIEMEERENIESGSSDEEEIVPKNV